MADLSRIITDRHAAMLARRRPLPEARSSSASGDEASGVGDRANDIHEAAGRRHSAALNAAARARDVGALCVAAAAANDEAMALSQSQCRGTGKGTCGGKGDAVLALGRAGLRPRSRHCRQMADLSREKRWRNITDRHAAMLARRRPLPEARSSASGDEASGVGDRANDIHEAAGRRHSAALNAAARARDVGALCVAAAAANDDAMALSHSQCRGTGKGTCGGKGDAVLALERATAMAASLAAPTAASASAVPKPKLTPVAPPDAAQAMPPQPAHAMTPRTRAMLPTVNKAVFCAARAATLAGAGNTADRSSAPLSTADSVVAGVHAAPKRQFALAVALAAAHAAPTAAPQRWPQGNHLEGETIHEEGMPHLLLADPTGS
jgi:hypothetical protein